MCQDPLHQSYLVCLPKLSNYTVSPEHLEICCKVTIFHLIISQEVQFCILNKTVPFYFVLSFYQSNKIQFRLFEKIFSAK